MNSGGRHIFPAIHAGEGATGAEIDIARRIGAEGVAIFASSIIAEPVAAEIDACFAAAADPAPCPWLDGSPDTTPPVISSVRMGSVGAREATILWHTDEETMGFADYGATPQCGWTVAEGAFAFDHDVTLAALSPETMYYARVRAKDAAGNESRSAIFSFRTTGEGPLVIVIDDGDPDCTLAGNWVLGTFAGGHDGDYRWTTDQPVATASATYRPHLPHAGAWEVSVHYVPGANRATDSPYTVVHAGGSRTIRVDQTAPADPWTVLGTFEFAAGSAGSVLLSNDASGGDVIVADAVRWQYAGPPPNPPFIRGDANGDGAIDLADAIAILDYLFGDAASGACPDALDVSDRGVIDLGDAIRLLGYLFAEGEPPRPPFPAPGHDPTPDDPFACGD